MFYKLIQVKRLKNYYSIWSEGCPQSKQYQLIKKAIVSFLLRGTKQCLTNHIIYILCCWISN